jgi:hypothetical protein
MSADNRVSGKSAAIKKSHVGRKREIAAYMSAEKRV